jgi:hypothetical protein
VAVVRRREPEPEGPTVPLELVEFEPERWPDVAAWCDARRSWVAVHGYPWDPIDWMRESVAAVREAARRA